MNEDELVKQFIKHDGSPDGKWFVEVPVGITLQENRDTDSSVKMVDAVCITSKQQE